MKNSLTDNTKLQQYIQLDKNSGRFIPKSYGEDTLWFADDVRRSLGAFVNMFQEERVNRVGGARGARGNDKA